MGAVVAKHIDMGVATGLTTATTEQLPKEEEGAGVGRKAISISMHFERRERAASVSWDGTEPFASVGT